MDDTERRTLQRRPVNFAQILADLGLRILLVALVMAGVLTLIFFPYATDAPLTVNEQAELQKYYATAYQKPPVEEKDDTRYVKIAGEQAGNVDVKGHVLEFARTFGLLKKKVLDIGAGQGYLQDVVANYTALDISPSAKRFYHKPFVLASATLMPLGTNEFDAAWSIWVLEHVPNPEAALLEMRRVVKDGGYIYLAPAWDCRFWAADGYPVRPYSDFGVGGKVIKASIPALVYFGNVSKFPIRLGRDAAWKVSGAPTNLHYRRITPNYDHYWMADSDAINTLDRNEVAIWFLSRGDECLNCESGFSGVVQENDPLIVKIHKRS